MKIFSLLLVALALQAETGYDAWLRYQPLSGPTLEQYRLVVPAVVASLDSSVVAKSAQSELVRGIRGMLGRTLREESALPKEGAIVLATLDELGSNRGLWHLDGNLAPDAYWIKTVVSPTGKVIVITASNARGLLYGSFALLRKIALHEPIAILDDKQTPYAPLRWMNQWDNMDGSIERGYGGRSIFWDGGHAREDLSRVNDYARLLASLGINACAVNNVNANPRMLAPEVIPQLAKIADVMRPWGIRLAIAVDFGSPKNVGGLDTFDPLDPKVAEWWKTTEDGIYKLIPDFAGVVLKADSEGRVGPSAYNRTHADAANVVARGLAAHGGVLFYRGFVYDHHMDYSDMKADRGRAAYDNFHQLDGKFDDNVIVQIKNGPIDFQVREPASPLFSGLEKSNQAIELQISQEYFGQAKHTVYMVPMWKATLDQDMMAKGATPTPVKALVAGKVFNRPLGGFVGVANVGLDENWCGNNMSQANLYGFARLAWNPDLTSKQIEDEWTKQTFGFDPKVNDTIASILLTSWRTFENYTGPLGLQNLSNPSGDHYSVNVDSSEHNQWGQWHRADETGVGMDRTVATGTGYIGQYRPGLAKIYESLQTCPDDLLLFMHHVPYSYKLHDGRSVAQYLYDTHYEGADAVANYVQQWKGLRGLVDDQRYETILAQLKLQAGQAVVWRDGVTKWFLAASKIPDAKGRVGHYPDRVEAETMKLEGYTVRPITPVENASEGKVVACPANTPGCAATTTYSGKPGWFTLNVQYYDLPRAVAHYRVLVGKQVVDEWNADLTLPARGMDAASSTRRFITGVALRPGDEIRIEGKPAGMDSAGLDYIEITPEK